MVQQRAVVDGRDMTRRVLADLAGGWAGVWERTRDMQQHNPDVMNFALAGSDDPEQAIAAILPHLALVHPRVVEAAVAFCHAVVNEFSDDENIRVSPPRDTPPVVREHTFGGGQQQDRAVELEEELAEARQHIAALLAVHEFDREVLRSIFGNAQMALERDG